MESIKKDLLTIKLKLDNPASTQPLAVVDLVINKYSKRPCCFLNLIIITIEGWELEVTFFAVEQGDFSFSSIH